MTGSQLTRRHLILCAVLVLTLSTHASAAGIPVIVQLAPTASLSSVLSVLGGTLVDTVPGANQYLINVPKLPLISPLLSLLGIQWLETNNGIGLFPIKQFGVLQAATGTADWYKNQPALGLIRSQQALAYSRGHGVVVAD